MKNWIITALFLGLSSGLVAQVPRKAPIKKATYKTYKQAKAQEKKTAEVVRISSQSDHAAMSNLSAPLRITDPTVRYYNDRVSGMPRTGDMKAIVGIPKMRGGLAHHKILFQPTGATNSGTATGTGAVGTGSIIGLAGASGAAMGVNGQNPYASPYIYGTRVVNDLRPPELSFRRD